MSEPKGMKTRYKTTNWTAYNAALKARGSLTIWFDKEMPWYAPASGKRGRQQTFTDAAIQFCLSIKCLFGLALRQSLGLVESLLRMAKLDWRVPNFSTISRRRKKLQVQLPYRASTTALDLLVDSVSADGAYDTRACHAAIAQRGAAAIIPPRKNAQLWPSALAPICRSVTSAGAKERNDAVQACKRLGWRIWKSWSCYHRRSLVEAKMHCFKRLGERVMARTFERQVTELHVRVALLNRFTQLGRPMTAPVVAMA